MPKIDPSELLTITECAQRLKIRRESIWDAINRGRLRALRVGNLYLITQSALKAYRDSRKRTGRPRKNL